MRETYTRRHLIGTAMAVAWGVTAAAAAIRARGQMKAASAQKKAGEIAGDAADAEGERFDYNAGVADLQAQDALDRGVDDEGRFRSSIRGLIGTQRATLAANGVVVGVGSAADVQADAAYLGERDAQQIKANAQREAWGFTVQADDLRKGGEVARKGGQAAREAGRVASSAGKWAVAGDLIGTGSSLAMQKYGWNKQ
jgi:hypothetical protein